MTTIRTDENLEEKFIELMSAAYTYAYMLEENETVTVAASFHYGKAVATAQLGLLLGFKSAKFAALSALLLSSLGIDKMKESA